MGVLSDIIKDESETIKRINEWNKKRGDAQPIRGYLGASLIGHHCDRYLWYIYRHCVDQNFTGRDYRLFETGDLEEERFVRELRGIGCEVHEVDENGKQFRVEAFHGHFAGHMDGCILGVPEAPKTWHVAEFKTHNAKSFHTLKQQGVKESKPQHYAQMQTYMGLTKMKRALYLAKNKDNDELYAERVHFEDGIFGYLMKKAERLIKTNEPPERCSTRADFYLCKWCDAKDICWGPHEVALPLTKKTCRTCCHSTPEMEGDKAGQWTCAKKDMVELTIHGQQQACESHLILPGFIDFADPVDASDSWIEFENHEDKARWRHGIDDSGTAWTTEQLMTMPRESMGSKAVANIKAVFPEVEVTECRELTLFEKYEGAELVWMGSLEDVAPEYKMIFPNREPENEEETGVDYFAEHLVDDENHYLVSINKETKGMQIWKGKI